MKNYLGKLLESGAMLALVTGVLYFLTYLRLDGVLTAYSLPDELVSIDPPDIIATLRNLIENFWPVLLIPALGLILMRGIQDQELVTLGRLTIVMLTAVAFSIALVSCFELKNLILIGICVYEWLEQLVKALLHGRSARGLKAKWKTAHAVEKTDNNQRAASAIGWLATAIAIMYVLSGSIMEHFASIELERDSYFVAEDYENQLVVFQNDDQYVLMTREGDELLPEYQIVHYRRIGHLRYEQTGVLRLKEAED